MIAASSTVGCSDDERAHAIGGTSGGGGSRSGDAGLLDYAAPDGPPTADASGLCGNQFFAASMEPPNLYFVIDRSGSMVDPAGVQGWSKYTAVRVAVVDVVREIGSRANFGAALYPGEPMVTGCETGMEVFATRRGDPVTGGGADGPVSKAMAAATDVEPIGGTPTAATLEVLAPTLAALPGKTAVVLATDGAPNCSAKTSCTASECVYNIEGESVGGKKCTSDYNCCDPALVSGPGPLMCVDGVETTLSVQHLRELGIRTFVVGIPGSAQYGLLLDQLATIGGSARVGEPKYYRIDDMESLSATLREIGTQVLVTCDFVLDQAPPEPSLVNVYFDQEAIAYDAEDGWTWTGAQTLSVHGEACDRLEEGAVGQVQVVAGCPTKQPL